MFFISGSPEERDRVRSALSLGAVKEVRPKPAELERKRHELEYEQCWAGPRPRNRAIGRLAASLGLILLAWGKAMP